MKKIDIVSSTNDKYTNYLIAMLISLVENTPNTYLNIHILYENLSEKNQKKIKEKITNFSDKLEVSFYKIDKKLFSRAILETYAQSSYEAYSRLLIPKILKGIDKVIYLDADTIVLNDLNILYEVGIENYEIAAVQDFNINSRIIFKKIFKLNDATSYFNSGVMIMNLKRLRNMNFTDNSLNFIEQTDKKYKFFDQDILNYFFSEKYLKIDPRWNIQLYLELATTNFSHSTLSKKEYEECKKDPFIIHYTIVKPDYLNYFFKYRKIYKYYLKKAGISFEYQSTTPKQLIWTIIEILFFKAINTLSLKKRNQILDYLRKFF